MIMATQTKGPDNNKRLAELESGVSAIAIALVANGFAPKAEEIDNPLELVIKAIKGQAEQIDAAEGRVGPLITATTNIAARYGRDVELAPLDENEDLVTTQIRILNEIAALPEETTPGELAAIRRAETAEGLTAIERERAELAETALEAANKEIAELNTDIEQLEGRIDQLQAADVANAEEPVNLARERPEHARDFGPTFDAGERKDIAKLIAAGEAFEIAFSNGEHEIVELAPIALEGKDLIAIEGRYLAPKIFAKGGEQVEHIHGAALLLGGEQIAYCEFPSPIAIEPRQERGFEKAITFG